MMGMENVDDYGLKEAVHRNGVTLCQFTVLISSPLNDV
jgi:hypothetical protein